MTHRTFRSASAKSLTTPIQEMNTESPSGIHLVFERGLLSELSFGVIEPTYLAPYIQLPAQDDRISLQMGRRGGRRLVATLAPEKQAAVANSDSWEEFMGYLVSCEVERPTVLHTPTALHIPVEYTSVEARSYKASYIYSSTALTAAGLRLVLGDVLGIPA
jgi:hypothetical protein